MTEVENASVHLTVSIRKDGVWLNFRASTGKHASLRIESLGEERRGIIGRALLDWCADQRANVLAQQTYDPRFDGDPSTWPLHNPAMPRSIEPPPKEWCEKMAQLEGDHEIGAGALAIDPEPDAPAQPTQISDEAVDAAISVHGGSRMKTYTVTVIREIRETLDLEIEAENEDDAKEKAKAKEDATPDDHWFYDYIRRTTEVHEKRAR
jgi:hypothetical protein